MVDAFSTISAKRINQLRNTPGEKLWQRNYWEYVVRNENDLAEIREYIRNNPARWEFDDVYFYYMGQLAKRPILVKNRKPDFQIMPFTQNSLNSCMFRKVSDNSRHDSSRKQR
ncbi:hypothetical protein BIU88_12400 [Chlorobaculum limnaeum]|uniref:Transposase IS200-like domain-containing protein n=1 Tax=Chlorobaculum limnaeum TaxID=274537 RepID=A0A1D8D5Z2_CHLLM|nr:hypothetical protein BIU88_12400 [Chlorobaculum limnaeum]